MIRSAFFAFCGAVCLFVFSSNLDAHHGGDELSVPSAQCGRISSENSRDRSNVSDFCTRWVAPEFRIQGASAMYERLWLEAPPELVSTLRDDRRRTAALLHEWLEHWRKITGYKTASVSLLRSHVEFARVQATMTGDAVMIR